MEDGVLDVCEELGIGLLAYAPLGRAMLTGRLRSLGDLGEADARRTWPRFSEENIDQNLELVGRLEAFAADKGATAGQLALAWLLAQRPWIVPIPGTKRVAYLEENAAAVEVELTAAELALLDETIPARAVAGEPLSAGADADLDVGAEALTETPAPGPRPQPAQIPAVSPPSTTQRRARHPGGLVRGEGDERLREVAVRGSLPSLPSGCDAGRPCSRVASGSGWPSRKRSSIGVSVNPGQTQLRGCRPWRRRGPGTS